MMTDADIRRAVAHAGSVLRCFAGDVRPERNALDRRQHIAWMIEEIPRLIADGKRDKAHRWLGFVQGYLWTTGYCAIDRLKSVNRPAEEPA